MKTYLYLFLLLPAFASSQVIIGSGKTTITNSSVSLEFGTEPKGILLPWVESAGIVQTPVPGTFLFDAADRRVKLKTATSWLDLTIDPTGIVDTTLQDLYSEKEEASVTIGKPTGAKGILLLEDQAKAMILPLVNSYKEIINPSAGMLVFDTSTQYLCTFNGKVWSFWKG